MMKGTKVILSLKKKEKQRKPNLKKNKLRGNQDKIKVIKSKGTHLEDTVKPIHT